MSKKTIVIASVLKPVNDTRMYEKMALSLAKANKYAIKIIGFSAKSIPKEGHISFHPIFQFKRLSLNRMFSSFRYYKELKSIAPELIIFNTHELLIPTMIYRWLYKVKVIYDVRENHFRNIMFTNAFPLLLRPILALWVRVKEYFFSVWIDHFFLAEKYYEKELHFTKGRYTILENKAMVSKNFGRVKNKNPEDIQLLFSGTLAESTGIFEAIDLAKKLHHSEPKIRLKIMGYSPNKKVVSKIKSCIGNSEFITLIGGNELVNHDRILNEIHQSNFGIINYPTNKSTINSTPTKLYEYLSNELPILIQYHDKWSKICEEYHAGITVDFLNIDAKSILNQMKNRVFYPHGVGEDFLWKSEEAKMLNLINKLLL